MKEKFILYNYFILICFLFINCSKAIGQPGIKNNLNDSILVINDTAYIVDRTSGDKSIRRIKSFIKQNKYKVDYYNITTDRVYVSGYVDLEENRIGEWIYYYYDTNIVKNKGFFKLHKNLNKHFNKNNIDCKFNGYGFDFCEYISNGLPHGEWFYYDKNGLLKYEATYEYGFIVKYNEFDEDRKIIKKKKYKKNSDNNFLFLTGDALYK